MSKHDRLPIEEQHRQQDIPRRYLNPDEDPEALVKRNEVAGGLFEVLAAALHEAGPEQVFVNGVDPNDGLTAEGKQIFDATLTKEDPNMLAAPNKPVGAMHPKFYFWKRPDND